MNPLYKFARAVREFLPTGQWVLNEIVPLIPVLAIRMRIYAAFGVELSKTAPASIMMHAELWEPRKIKLGRRSVIGRYAVIDARGGVEIGDDVNISGYSHLQTAKHDVNDPDFIDQYGPIVIGPRAWLGMGATVLGGVTIGEGAVVAAGAVVTKSVAPFQIVAGIPAVPIGTRSDDLRYELNYRPRWV